MPTEEPENTDGQGEVSSKLKKAKKEKRKVEDVVSEELNGETKKTKKSKKEDVFNTEEILEVVTEKKVKKMKKSKKGDETEWDWLREGNSCKRNIEKLDELLFLSTFFIVWSNWSVWLSPIFILLYCNICHRMYFDCKFKSRCISLSPLF